ncbi:MAG: DUF2905 domain-containing protein [Anaerolineae bacterium]|nr:DUF2905 domain-containing protein [Anaerolineae bacterium]
MDLQSVGRLLVIGGIAAAVIGGILILLSRLPFFNQLGRLPGDIRIEGQGFSCFIPVVSMILLSILLTIVLNIIIRFINRP